ncbi:MAG: hypothetical protein KJZ93_19010 [Caldilineaceae bacterium]|nr:hypothetical protein [Caldilineaceae bacterium]
MYTVYVLPRALQEIKRLPGHVRQRVKRLIDDLAEDPRPPGVSNYRTSLFQSLLSPFIGSNWQNGGSSTPLMQKQLPSM